MMTTRSFLVLSTLGLVGALLTTTFTAYGRIQEAAVQVTRGEAESLLRTLRAELRGQEGEVSTEDLLELVGPEGVPGLLYVGLFLADGTLTVEAGTREALDNVGSDLRPTRGLASISIEGARAVGAGYLAGGRRPGAHHSLRRRRLRPDRAVYLLFEYRSDLAQKLARSGTRSLWVGGFSAFVFLLCAGFLNRLLEEREALAERQARQQRLASLGEMSAVLAHEIRNPLTSLKGHAQLLSETSPEEGKARKKADRIASEVGRLEALVNDLLDFVRAGTVDLRETDPLLILREAVTLIEGGERVRVVSEGTTTSWNLDPIRFRQVLVNLIQNACQVSPEGAEVEVTLGSKRGVLEIRVQDRGPGVPEGEEERIFEPFVTGRSHGTGLGLAVARRLTELHGGTLKVVSSEGIGACFQARFPRVEDQEGR